MTTTVHIWLLSSGNVGHVSLSIDNQYISFWPSGAAGKKDFKIGQTHEPSFPSSYKIDKRLERKDCDHTVTLTKMDEKLMLKCWAEFKQNPKRYNMVKQNCSTVVAWLLEIGSGVLPGGSKGISINDWVSNPFQKLIFKIKYFGNQIDMWTPNDVHRFALQIKSTKG
ncbi:MAG: DUF4105 domain-containing protein [Pseudomonadota bacterium]